MTATPSTITPPSVGARMPEISDNSVLLPQPLWPMMATNSPGAIFSDMSLSASVSPSRPKYRRPTPRSSTLAWPVTADVCTDHFALSANSVSTRVSNFTRLALSSTLPSTRMSWNLSMAFGSIFGVLFQMLSLR